MKLGATIRLKWRHTKAINHVGNPPKMPRQRSPEQERFGPSVLRPFEPCAATVFGRQVPFSQVACATWKDNQLRYLYFPSHHPSQVLACEPMLLPRRHETSGTLALLRRVPSFRASQPPELYARFQHARCNTGASLSVFHYRLARVGLLRASLSSGSQSA